MKRGRSNPDSFNPYTVRRASENVAPLNATELLMRSAAAGAAARKAKSSAYGFTATATDLVPCCSCGKVNAPRMNNNFKCSFCEKQFCEDCSRRCCDCGYVFCSNCAGIVYEGRYEYPLCITCSSNHKYK